MRDQEGSATSSKDTFSSGKKTKAKSAESKFGGSSAAGNKLVPLI